MADNPILPRKFYRITGLHNVFTVTDNIYNINVENCNFTGVEKEAVKRT